MSRQTRLHEIRNRSRSEEMQEFASQTQAHFGRGAYGFGSGVLGFLVIPLVSNYISKAVLEDELPKTLDRWVYQGVLNFGAAAALAGTGFCLPPIRGVCNLSAWSLCLMSLGQIAIGKAPVRAKAGLMVLVVVGMLGLLALGTRGWGDDDGDD